MNTGLANENYSDTERIENYLSDLNNLEFKQNVSHKYKKNTS